jgi:hypothetical protein
MQPRVARARAVPRFARPEIRPALPASTHSTTCVQTCADACTPPAPPGGNINDAAVPAALHDAIHLSMSGFPSFTLGSQRINLVTLNSASAFDICETSSEQLRAPATRAPGLVSLNASMRACTAAMPHITTTIIVVFDHDTHIDVTSPRYTDDSHKHAEDHQQDTIRTLNATNDQPPTPPEQTPTSRRNTTPLIETRVPAQPSLPNIDLFDDVAAPAQNSRRFDYDASHGDDHDGVRPRCHLPTPHLVFGRRFAILLALSPTFNEDCQAGLRMILHSNAPPSQQADVVSPSSGLCPCCDGLRLSITDLDSGTRRRERLPEVPNPSHTTRNMDTMSGVDVEPSTPSTSTSPGRCSQGHSRHEAASNRCRRALNRLRSQVC